MRYDEGDHFGCPVMNFSDADVPYTRAIEFKNFNPERRDAQNHEQDSGVGGILPLRRARRRAVLPDQHGRRQGAVRAVRRARAAAEPNVVFGGRLGTYKYYDMHNVIDAALTAYEEQVAPMLRAR